MFALFRLCFGRNFYCYFYVIFRILFDRVSNPQDLHQPLSTEEEDTPSTSSETIVHRHPSLKEKE